MDHPSSLSSSSQWAGQQQPPPQQLRTRHQRVSSDSGMTSNSHFQQRLPFWIFQLDRTDPWTPAVTSMGARTNNLGAHEGLQSIHPLQVGLPSTGFQRCDDQGPQRLQRVQQRKLVSTPQRQASLPLLSTTVKCGAHLPMLPQEHELQGRHEHNARSVTDCKKHIIDFPDHKIPESYHSNLQESIINPAPNSALIRRPSRPADADSNAAMPLSKRPKSSHPPNVEVDHDNVLLKACCDGNWNEVVALCRTDPLLAIPKLCPTSNCHLQARRARHGTVRRRARQLWQERYRTAIGVLLEYWLEHVDEIQVDESHRERLMLALNALMDAYPQQLRYLHFSIVPKAERASENPLHVAVHYYIQHDFMPLSTIKQMLHADHHQQSLKKPALVQPTATGLFLLDEILWELAYKHVANIPVGKILLERTSHKQRIRLLELLDLILSHVSRYEEYLPLDYSPLLRFLTRSRVSMAPCVEKERLRISLMLPLEDAIEEDDSIQNNPLVACLRRLISWKPSLIHKRSALTACTPLHEALWLFQSCQCRQRLCRRRCRVQHDDKHHASCPERVALNLIHELLRSDSSSQNLKMRDHQGNLPLHIACSAGVSFDILNLILERMSAESVWSTNNMGQSPIDMAWIHHVDRCGGDGGRLPSIGWAGCFRHRLLLQRRMEESRANQILLRYSWRDLIPAENTTEDIYETLLQLAANQTIKTKTESTHQDDAFSSSSFDSLQPFWNISIRLVEAAVSKINLLPWQALPLEVLVTLNDNPSRRLPHADHCLHRFCALSGPFLPRIPQALLDIVFDQHARHCMLLSDDSGMLPLHHALAYNIQSSHMRPSFICEDKAVKAILQWSSWVHEIIKHSPRACEIQDRHGRLAIHYVCDDRCLSLSGSKSISLQLRQERAKLIHGIAKTFPAAVVLIDPITGLYPYQLMAVGTCAMNNNDDSTDKPPDQLAVVTLDTIYFLLRRSPNVIGIHSL